MHADPVPHSIANRTEGRRLRFLAMLELRRARRSTIVAAQFSAAVVAWMVLGDPQATSPAMFGISCALMFAMTPAVNAFRDRLEGTLWLVSMLPVAPRTASLARVIAIVVLAVPAALMLGIVFIEIRSMVPLTGGQLALLVTAMWPLCVLAGVVMMVPALALTPERLQWMPVGVLAIGLSIARLLEVLVDDPVAALNAALGHPWAVPVAILAATALCAGALYASVAIVARAIARFEQPDLVRDLVTRGRLK